MFTFEKLLRIPRVKRDCGSKLVKDKLFVVVTVIVVVLLESLSDSKTEAFLADITVSSIDPDENGTVTELKCEFSVETSKLPLEIHGGIVNSVPVNACDIVTTPPKTEEQEPFSWILLTTKSDCDFNTKMTHAQNSGYSALLIFDEHSNSTFPMPIHTKYFNKYFIFSCFLGQYAGALLQNNFTYQQGFTVGLAEETDESSWGHIFVLSLIVALLFVAVACCFCMSWVFVTVTCWPRVEAFRNILRDFVRERRRARRNHLFATALKQVAVEKWNQNQLSESCAICMEEFQTDDDMKILNCNHGFHPHCIDEWLVYGRRFCPLCGRRVILENHQLFSNTDSENEDDTTPLLSHSHERTRMYSDLLQLPSQQRVNPFLRGNTLLTHEHQTNHGVSGGGVEYVV